MNKRTSLYCDTRTKEQIQRHKTMNNQSDLCTIKLMMLYISKKGSIDQFKQFSHEILQGGLGNVKLDKKTNTIIQVKA